ncbi:MAG TPA: BatD family protein [Opitutaceae bacterium]|nr:BatD family protein [Opitutaceae bacterium]
MLRRLLLLPVLLAAAAGPARAQRVYWEPGAGSLAFNQASQLQLVFENCTPENEPPKPPAVDGLELQFAGTGSSFSMENMNVTRKQIYTFMVRPTKRPEVRIPAFEIATDKGPQKVDAAVYAIGNATVGQTAVPLESAAKTRLTPVSGEFWAGEVFPVTYTLDIARRFRPRPPGPVNWTPGPLSVEDWSQPEQFESTTGGEAHIGLVYKTRGYVASPGTYKIPAATQEIVLVVDTSGSLFSFPSAELVQHTVTSNQPALTIKPLPDDAPADFGGAVGQFTLRSKVVPTTVGVGEPITWTLELAGTGNWPDIRGLPAREASKDFKILQPQSKRTPVAGKLFDATLSEDVVLIPTKPGTYTLDPVSYSYFDPRSGTYQTVKTAGFTVTITPAGAAEPAAGSFFTAPTLASAATPTPAAPALTPPPAAPAAIPRDPLPGAHLGFVPLPADQLTLAVVLSVLWLVPAWLLLAALRSRRTDPLRPRREARRRLEQTLAYLRGTTGAAARGQALHAWQTDAAVLLGVEHAAPSPAIVTEQSDFPDPSTQNPKLKTQNLAAWAALWAEADRALYGSDGALPGTWQVRAEAALEAARVPGWRQSSLFQARNLFPWIRSNTGNRIAETGKTAAVTVLAVLLCYCTIRNPQSAMAADGTSNQPRTLNYYPGPIAAYNAGDFAAAEQAWRATIARTPADWVARHNLALALAQQGQWPEAAAHWTSAFLLDPRNESVRWHLGLGYERAGYTPPDLGEFAAPSGPHLVARLASPAEWQWILVAAGVVFAGGLLLLILRGYRAPNRWMRPAAFAGMGAGLVLAVAAATSLHFYGDTVNPRAVLVWHQVLLRSIPTEADTQQKTSSLPAGSLAVVDKEFLGWARLAFANGQTGWVRQDDIVWLYR